MKTYSSILFVPALAALLLTGCDASLGYRHVHYDPNGQPPYDNDPSDTPSRRPSGPPSDTGGRHVREVRGTVVSVDPDEQSIVLSPAGDRDDRNDRGDRERDLVLHYDDSTRVEYEGRTYGPENLEPGDQIDAVVERGSEGLLTQAIQVLSDVRGGPEGMEEQPGGDQDRGDQDNGAAAQLEGVVRSNDTSRHTVEVQTVGSRGERSSVVVVHYDDDTQVEFQGRLYGPENLEQGDAVEIELREDNGRPVAERIVVVGEGRRVRS
jgi:hypothetical protein